jgi:L-ascorbate metabolism protein UlaG (beta-lactamase superfamily)
MIKIRLLALFLLVFCVINANSKEAFEKDIIKTPSGDLEITFIGHGSLMLRFGGLIIHIDPFGRLADYAALPKASLIFITHDHQDHLDPEALQKISGKNTTIILTEKCADKIKQGIIMKNNEVKTIKGILVEAVPAYNLVHKRDNGELFHPKGDGNGYVLTFGGKRVYIAGDTENTPEMKSLKNIDCAFLPMNLPYTMTPEMVADAAKAFKPKVLYPYHFGGTDTSRIVELLKDVPEIEVRVRKMN